MAPSPEEARAAFIRTFKNTARHMHRYEVWRDFVTMAACALHNGPHKDDKREAEYLEIIHRYDKDDQHRFPELLSHLVNALQAEPRDVLGPLYMELEIASKDRGQFFTPPALSEVMAQMTFAAELDKLAHQDFITAQEPACGAGGMVLSLVKVMIAAGHDPAQRLWVQCIDVDRLAALMCFVQLTLWNVPAQVVVGNTLTLETREVWHTPAYHLGFWDHKLKRKDQTELQEEPAPEDGASPDYEQLTVDWRGQEILVRYCPSWLGQETAHLEIATADRTPHPISETGYRSHFVHPVQIEEAGGPVAYVTRWLSVVDDGKPKQLSLF